MTKKILLLSLVLISLAPFVYASCATLDITDEVVGGFFVGTPVNVQMHACCGTAPYTWTITSGGLPPGLSMNSSGQITGTPTTAGDYFVCIKVTDAAGCTLTKCFFVEVN